MAMKKKIPIAVMLIVAVGLFMAASAMAGSLDSPASPTDPASAMWTLDNIYNVLDTRATNVAKRAGGFTAPAGGPTNGTMRTLNDIMTLVTNRAPVPKTGQTASWALYDDGWYSTNGIGVAWPTNRFALEAESGDGTNCVRDNLTGLIWARNANIASNLLYSATSGQVSQAQALNVITNAGGVNGTAYGGRTDWRLPNVRELQSLLAYKFYAPALCNTAGTAQWTENDPFTGVGATKYWSSTKYADGTTGYAWTLQVSDGYLSYGDAGYSSYYAWPVRGGR